MKCAFLVPMTLARRFFEIFLHFARIDVNICRIAEDGFIVTVICHETFKENDEIHFGHDIIINQ